MRRRQTSSHVDRTIRAAGEASRAFAQIRAIGLVRRAIEGMSRHRARRSRMPVAERLRGASRTLRRTVAASRVERCHRKKLRENVLFFE